MSRRSLVLCALAALGASAFAQQPISRSMLRPVTSTPRNAGVYYFGLGTWTRHVDATNATNYDIVYANTCPIPYYVGQFLHEYSADEGRLPGPDGPVLCDTGLLSTNRGCSCSYPIEGFEIAYCTSVASNVSFNVGFQDAYVACAAPVLTHGPFTLSGLPGAGSMPQACWTVIIDLGASSQSFMLAGDGASCTWLSQGDMATNHLFGWTFENLNNVQNTLTSFAGPILAGGDSHFPLCSMVDGTRWDTLTCSNEGGGSAKWPNNIGETGWGMDTQDRFRDDTTVAGGMLTPPSGPGCYFFGGNPYASFHMRLFSANECKPCPPGGPECRPGIDFPTNCPCSGPPPNNPTTLGAGCNALTNPGPTQTGGAQLTPLPGCGATSLSGMMPGIDTLQLNVTGLPTSATESAYLLQGTTIIAPVVFGQGLRCVAGQIKRLQIHSPASGHSTWPAPGDFQPTIQARSAQLGDPLMPGSIRHYFVQYRQALFESGCVFPNNFNASNATMVTWSP
jgi:hypothetical protein